MLQQDEFVFLLLISPQHKLTLTTPAVGSGGNESHLGVNKNVPFYDELYCTVPSGQVLLLFVLEQDTNISQLLPVSGKQQRAGLATWHLPLLQCADVKSQKLLTCNSNTNAEGESHRKKYPFLFWCRCKRRESIDLPQ